MRELTPEVAAALERLRRARKGECLTIIYPDPRMKVDVAKKRIGDYSRMDYARAQLHVDEENVSDAMLSLYPPGHADPITPERLVACGGEIAESTTGTSILVDLGDNLWAWYVKDRIIWVLDGINIPERAGHRNMGGVWELLDRLGIEWRKTKGGV